MLASLPSMPGQPFQMIKAYFEKCPESIGPQVLHFDPSSGAETTTAQKSDTTPKTILPVQGESV